MDPKIVDSVTEWDPVTAMAGSVDLRSLARDEFSGAVTAGPTWALFINGRIVGVFDGSVEDLDEGTDLTAYRAPDASLPLLYAMQETGGETRAKYYSKETPLREVDQTLSSGKFTGYVELSENVLSGDYYVVYYGGRSMSVAFVGASGRLVTGDEAFDLAADEVGIYAVNAVDVSIVDLPEGVPSPNAEPSEGDESADAAGADEPVDGGSAAPADERGAPDESSGQAGVTFGAAAADGTDDADATSESEEASARRATESDLTGGMGIGLNSASEPEDTTDGEGVRDEAGDGSLSPDRTVGDTDSETVEGADAAAVEGADADAVGAVDADTVGDTDVVESNDAETDDVGAADEEPGLLVGDDAEAGDSDESEAFGPEQPARDTDESDDPEAEASHADDPETDTATSDAGTVTNDRPQRDAGADGTPRTSGPNEATDDGTTGGSEPDSDETDDAAAVAGRDGGGVFTDERRWQETRRIPALAPEESLERDGALGTPGVGTHTADGRGDGDDGHGAAGDEPQEVETADTTRAASTNRDSTSPSAMDGYEHGPKPATASADTDTEGEGQGTAALEARLERVTTERDELEAAVERLESEVDTVTDERDRLRRRIAELEAEVERLRSETGSQSDADGPRLSPDAARDGTNLFVRYRSKGKPTLKKARSGDAKQGEVVENLRLEYHTTFDSESATVDGEPYEAFLHGTTEWQFTTWVVEELLYEIGRSGHRTDMAPLFDRIPEIDRIQFGGEVPVTVEDEEKQRHESRTFDLVFWDSMGDPLFVADVDASRNATTQGMVGSLIEGARAVGGSKDTLGAAFFVTTSFFEPGALDAVGEETKSGLLRRGSKKSFVKTSRKQGYHLCLVEARDGEIHLSVPEL